MLAERSSDDVEGPEAPGCETPPRSCPCNAFVARPREPLPPSRSSRLLGSALDTVREKIDLSDVVTDGRHRADSDGRHRRKTARITPGRCDALLRTHTRGENRPTFVALWTLFMPAHRPNACLATLVWLVALLPIGCSDRSTPPSPHVASTGSDDREAATPPELGHAAVAPQPVDSAENAGPDADADAADAANAANAADASTLTPSPPPPTSIDASTARRLLAQQAATEVRLHDVRPFGAAFRHPVGFYFSFPEDWRVSPEASGLLSLIPPDALRSRDGPTELFLVLGDHADSLRDPTSPDAIRTAERIVTTAFPFLRRDDAIVPHTTHRHRAAVLNWIGTSPAQIECRGRLYFTILDSWAAGLLVVTPRETLARRTPTAEEIFSTFDAEQPRSDSRLLGTWRQSSTTGSSSDVSPDDPRSPPFTMSVQYLFLLADGTCFEDHLPLGRTAHSHGRWRGADGRITIERAAGGMQSWGYYISHDDLLLEDNSERRLFRRVR